MTLTRQLGSVSDGAAVLSSVRCPEENVLIAVEIDGLAPAHLIDGRELFDHLVPLFLQSGHGLPRNPVF